MYIIVYYYLQRYIIRTKTKSKYFTDYIVSDKINVINILNHIIIKSD